MRKSSVRSYILDPVEALRREELDAIQLQRLRAGIERISQTVPFYRRKLDEAGISGDSIRSLRDLATLPKN